ncbi:hypothetical protein H1P_2830001 [Hyella patelloides LEGE 07179]|uniref:Uncharacterized protein n=1 Tax=Hyella patelloides LEGE 07179 TaxID=945734 RepID=A0A563VTJ1_9CYAN|nr:hypothetical protein [Hyella patelloides]VEP14733.1 hypothetical protein H1P_2830001 [Hyella patelloides LEGE 07179]
MRKVGIEEKFEGLNWKDVLQKAALKYPNCLIHQVSTYKMPPDKEIEIIED